MTDGRFTIGLVASEEMSALRRATDAIAASALIQRRDDTILTEAGARQVTSFGVSEGFFELFGLPMAAGRGFTAEDFAAPDRSRVVLSQRAWRTMFGASPFGARHDDSVCRRERAGCRCRTGKLRHPARGRPLVRATQPRLDWPRLRRVRALQAGGEPRPGSPGSCPDVGRPGEEVSRPGEESRLRDAPAPRRRWSGTSARPAHRFCRDRTPAAAGDGQRRQPAARAGNCARPRDGRPRRARRDALERHPSAARRIAADCDRGNRRRRCRWRSPPFAPSR